MYTTKKLIEALAKSGKSSEEIAQSVERCENIRQNIYRIKKQQEMAKLKYDSELARINMDLQFIQKDCKHYLTTYYSCQYDGYVECDICGKQL